jgi:hypothetical protein
MIYAHDNLRCLLHIGGPSGHEEKIGIFNHFSFILIFHPRNCGNAFTGNQRKVILIR